MSSSNNITPVPQRSTGTEDGHFDDISMAAIAPLITASQMASPTLGGGSNDEDSGDAAQEIERKLRELNVSRTSLGRIQSRLQLVRDQASRGRLQLGRKRSDLRELRHQIREQETEFISTLSGLLPPVASDVSAVLFKLHDDLRSLHGRLDAGERSFDQNEDAVAADEYTLSQEEAHFYASIAEMFPFDPAPPTLASSLGPLHQTPAPPTEPASSTTLELERKVGEAKRVRERLDDLVFEKEELEEEWQSGVNQGEREEADLRFLETFDETFEKNFKRLGEVEKEVAALEKSAMESGLLHPSSAYIKSQGLFPFQIDEEQGTPDNPRELRHQSRTPNMTSGLVNVGFVLGAPDTTTAVAGNLHRIASSSAETADGPHLAQTASRAPILDVEQWINSLPRFKVFEDLVGTFTSRDGRGRGFEKSRLPSLRFTKRTTSVELLPKTGKSDPGPSSIYDWEHLQSDYPSCENGGIRGSSQVAETGRWLDEANSVGLERHPNLEVSPPLPPVHDLVNDRGAEIVKYRSL